VFSACEILYDNALYKFALHCMGVDVLGRRRMSGNCGGSGAHRYRVSGTSGRRSACMVDKLTVQEVIEAGRPDAS